MKKTNILLILVFSILLVGNVMAEGVAEQYPSSLTIFWNNLIHNFQIYSVVGDDRSCGLSGGNPNYQWSVASGSNFLTGMVLSGSRPSSITTNPTNVIIDIFTNGWTPFVETKNFLTYGVCGTGPCNIEIYVCPSPEPTSQSSCPSGTTFTSVSCPTWSGTSFYKCPTETRIPYYYSSYNYCSVSSTKTCWYKSGTTCNTRTYDTSLFPNACSTYTYNSLPLYNDQSSCLASVCVPLWQTGSWSTCVSGTQTRSVTDSNNCGTTSGKPATSQSCTSGCTSNEACTIDGCAGTKTCSGGVLGACIKTVASCGTCTNPSNWVTAYTECCGIKPFGCTDKRCVATEAECGICGCGTVCAVDSDCCQGNVCGMNGDYQEQKCIAFKCTIQCKLGYTKCPNDDRCVNNIETDCGGNGTGNAKTITWTEFYSMSNEDFAKTNNRCKTNSDCTLIEGHNVSCIDNKIMADRTFNAYKDGCDKYLKWMDDTINLLYYICPICPGSFSICGTIAEGKTSWDNYFSGSKYCVAESSTWYGKIWEGALKLIGSLGIPAQWVMLATIGIIAILLMFIINFVKK